MLNSQQPKFNAVLREVIYTEKSIKYTVLIV